MTLMLRGRYLHPSGQIPAYEWNFSDVNPPVHAWATLFLHRTEQALRGEADLDFLKLTFHKLLLNFTWWVNRKDRYGKNVFEGGFLGLDNIGIFDRSAPLPTGGYLEQADGTAWMALFSQNMAEIALELATEDPIVRGHGVQVHRALPVHRRGDEPARRGRDVGRGGRLLLRSAAAARRQRHATQGALDGRAAAAVRHDGDRAVAARARSAGAGRDPGAPAADARAHGQHPPHRPGAPWRGRARDHGAGQPGPAAPHSRHACSTSRSSSAPTASARSRSSTRSTRTS